MKKLRIILFSFLLLLMVFPLLVLAVCSFLLPEHADALLAGAYSPPNFTLIQFQELFIGDFYTTMFMNSVKMTFFAVLLHLPVSVMTGLMLWRAKGRLKKGLMIAYMAALLLPFQSIMLPVYQIFRVLRIQDSLWSIIALAAFAPLGPLVIAAWLNQMPDDCWEAALLETNSLFKIMLHILIPQMLHILLVLGFVTIAEVWNMTEQPLILLQEIDMRPLSAVYNNTQRAGNSIAYAGSMLYFMPCVVVTITIYFAGKGGRCNQMSE